MRAWRGVLRYVAALVLVVGLMAGVLGQAAAQQDATPVPSDSSQVTIHISSSDPSVTTMPAGSWWTVSSTTGGEVAGGDFSGDQLELPTTVTIDTPVPYGEYLVTVGATWVFAPYEHVHTADSPTETWSVVLDPYVEQPVPSSLSLSIAGGGEADVSLTWALDDAASMENVAGGSGVYSLPTMLWEGTLMPGDYWVSIYPDGDYAAISELVTVEPRVPSSPFAFELIPIHPDPTPTSEPTAEPTHTDKHKDHTHKKDETKEEVTTLPSTGQGSGPSGDGDIWTMTLGAASLLLLAVSLVVRSRRAEGWRVDTRR